MSRILPALLLSGAFFIGAILPTWAAESWVSDPKTGTKIGWVSDAVTLVAASWSGGRVAGKAQGKGILTVTIRDKNGKDRQARADAEMVAGMLDGKVSIKWLDGESYAGDYKTSLRDGKGKAIYANGNAYDGEWKHGRMEGRGNFTYVDGHYYKGEFKNNEPAGKIENKGSDGEEYVGDFFNGHREGRGILKWPNGQVYEGEFKNHQIEGRGKIKYLNGAVYEGEFVNHRPSGHGVLKDAQGAVIFSGEWNGSQDDSLQQFGEAAAPSPVSAPIAPVASRPTAPATALAPPTVPAPAPRTQAPTYEANVSSDRALLRELRERLYELNFDPAAADAPFAEADRQSIREFEEKNNLPQTGEATVALLNNMRAAGAHSPWGAIVFAKSNGKWGMAWGHASRKEAVVSAVSSCGDARQCTMELSFFGTECGAFAYSGTTWALTARANVDKAKEAALADCQKGGRSCRIVATVCASGSDRRQADRQE